MIHTYESCVKQGSLPTKSIPLFHDWDLKQGDLYLDFEKWWKDIIEPCKYFYCITYTANAERLKKCKKLVVSRKVIGKLPKNLEVRYAGNMHSKVYIVFNKEYFPCRTVWLGSGNCVNSSYHHNIMIEAKSYNESTLIKYFEHVWELAHLERDLFDY